MKQEPLFIGVSVPEQQSVCQQHRASVKVRKELVRARSCLMSALNRVLQQYAQWGVEEIKEHLKQVKVVSRLRKLHQFPVVFASVHKYALPNAGNQRSRIVRDLELAARWYNLGLSRAFREIKAERLSRGSDASEGSEVSKSTENCEHEQTEPESADLSSQTPS